MKLTDYKRSSFWLESEISKDGKNGKIKKGTTTILADIFKALKPILPLDWILCEVIDILIFYAVLPRFLSRLPASSWLVEVSPEVSCLLSRCRWPSCQPLRLQGSFKPPDKRAWNHRPSTSLLFKMQQDGKELLLWVQRTVNDPAVFCRNFKDNTCCFALRIGPISVSYETIFI